MNKGFTYRYNVDILIYYEEYDIAMVAIEREKYLKGKRRSFKENLINSLNPEWNDLSINFN